MVCPKCGFQNAEGSKYCMSCGYKLVSNAPKKRIAPVIIILICVAIVGGCIGAIVQLSWHKHDWANATCFTPMTCRECGKTEGQPLAHKWEVASCTEPKHCTVCGLTEGNRLAHTVMNATCTEPGKCMECGEVVVEALGHNWIEATYSAPKTCNVCGATEEEKLKAEPIYLNDMDYLSKSGKLWTRSERAAYYFAHQNANNAAVWENEDVPGHTVGKVFDNQGNQYQYGLHLDGSETRTYYISYELNGIYTRFTGWCAYPGRTLSNYAQYSEKYIEIYADGRLVYVTRTMNADSKPEYIEIDVTNVKVLTIQYPASQYPNEAATLFDGKLS